MTTAFDAPHDELEGRYWSPTRIALSAVVVLIAAMWVWIYLWAPRDNPDRLVDRTFTAEAEAICAPLQQRIDDLPAGNNVTTPAQRARQVEEGTALTIEMVNALETAATRVTEASDVQILEAWFEDWSAYITDREVHVDKLDAATPDTSARDLAFTLTERASGGIYTTRIDGLANVNDMASCHVPRDV